MNTLHKCCGRVSGGSFYTSSLCGRNAKFERDGKHFCGTHDPVPKQAKAEAKYLAWRAESDAKRAAQLETQRRVDLFPVLLEALRDIAKNDPHRLMTSGDIAREAIAKATGEAL